MTLETKKLVIEEFSAGLELYKARRFPESIERFNAALAIDPDDGPSKLYVERAEDFIQNPPPENWDGVYVMKTK